MAMQNSALIRKMKKEPTVATKYGKCPSCGHIGTFTLLGEQTWPPAVAKKLGLPTTIMLWTCPSCKTTISDPELITVEPAVAGYRSKTLLR